MKKLLLILILSSSSLAFSKEFRIPELTDVSCWSKDLSNKDIETCNQLIFMDVDFDGQNEIIKRDFRGGQRVLDRFIIYKHSGKEMHGVQIKLMDYPPFDDIDNATTFDSSNKEILMHLSGGACGSENRTYKKISSKWTVIKRIFNDQRDGICYELTYEIDDNLELKLINKIKVY